MTAKHLYGLEQARSQLPHIVSEAHAGTTSVITKHGKPWAAVVSLQALEKLQAQLAPKTGLMALRGTGAGLWGSQAGRTVAALREEWSDRPGA